MGSTDEIDTHFEVTISGDSTAQFQGGSTFGTFADSQTERRGTIIILAPLANDQRAINFYGFTLGQVETGSYSIIASVPGQTFEPLN